LVIINSGKYDLVDNYAGIFRESGEWSTESIFEINYKDDQNACIIINQIIFTTVNNVCHILQSCSITRIIILIHLTYIGWAGENLTKESATYYEAQARVLRVFYYTWLWKFYGNIP